MHRVKRQRTGPCAAKDVMWPSTEAIIGRIHNMLYNLPRDVKNSFIGDIEGILCFTDLAVADEIVRDTMKLTGISAKSAVVDVTAGLGGMTIALAQHFDQVMAIELDADRVAALSANLKLLGIDNVKLITGYFQEHIEPLNDVVFFDPPWGLDYKKHKMIRLGVRGHDVVQPLEEVVLGIWAKYIVLKLPLNYDIWYLIDAVALKYGVCRRRVYREPNSMFILTLVNNAWLDKKKRLLEQPSDLSERSWKRTSSS